MCLDLGDQGIIIPKTVDELVERILKLAHVFLGCKICDFVNSSKGYTVDMLEGDKLYMDYIEEPC